MSIVNEALKKAAREDTASQAAEKHGLSFSAKAGFLQTLIKIVSVIFLVLSIVVVFTQRNLLIRWWSQLHQNPVARIPPIAANPTDIQSAPAKLNPTIPASKDTRAEQKTMSGQGEVEPLLTSGFQLFKERKFKEAEQEFSKVLSLQPGNAVAHNNLGLALKSQDHLAEAEVQYLAALQSNPLYPEALNNLGLLYEQQGRVQDAIQQYRKAIEISPTYPEAHLNYAQILERAGYPDEARRHYQAFLSADSAISSSLRFRVEQHLNSLP